MHAPGRRVERRGLEGHCVRTRIDRAVDLLAVPRHDDGDVVPLLRRRPPVAIPRADQRIPFLCERQPTEYGTGQHQRTEHRAPPHVAPPHPAPPHVAPAHPAPPAPPPPAPRPHGLILRLRATHASAANLPCRQ